MQVYILRSIENYNKHWIIITVLIYLWHLLKQNDVRFQPLTRRITRPVSSVYENWLLFGKENCLLYNFFIGPSLPLLQPSAISLKCSIFSIHVDTISLRLIYLKQTSSLFFIYDFQYTWYKVRFTHFVTLFIMTWHMGDLLTPLFCRQHFSAS